MRTASVTGAVLAILATGVSAQNTTGPLSSVLVIGSRVRITSSTFDARPTGMVTALDEGELTIAIDERIPLKVPLASITRLETSLGRKRNTLKGLGIGAASGLLLGLVMPVDPDNCGYYSDNFCSRGESLLGGTLGAALIGAGIGALIKSDRWSRLTLNATGPASNGRPNLVRVSLRLKH